MEKKIDLRVIKTNRSIKNAFIKLLNKKDFASITVQDIIDEALINRTTFYKHYADKYDLVETISKDFIEQFRIFTNIQISSEKQDFNTFINSMDSGFQDFFSYKDMLLGLKKVHTEKVNVYAEMEGILKQKYKVIVGNRINKHFNIDYQSSIFAAIILTTIDFVMESKDNFTAMDLIKELRFYYSVISEPFSSIDKEL
ncbi:transcriptional regulator, TetR family [Clostridioides difficile]|uniref:TetR/AcrR family transcriptional regulator n=1 Tax=Clostridioides difficile TaxID=1496 RepID=UPI000D1EF83C|nr:TetR family transcriptional regulator [Clostridioides difficile]UWD40474.1 TetR family transcriptional regulator [Clostridioides difficile]UWD44258.1 TetR family transcriptional regulator [Clostridioides difficile]VFF94812.1 transcriptional regulator, TetR family [Clostridioides difficile]VIG12735.1 transcriptional regulator, TetR family [Clostridioides difficile]HBE9437490.1 TetR/AcrR family transcriptional regulator [Clostridioides difficile]